MKKEVAGELIVVKRSGQRVTFNSNKIAIVIKHAFDSVLLFNHEKEINKVYENVLEYINEVYIDRKTINVEDIQDIIETKLKQNKFNDVYESFRDYRNRRAASRKAFNIKQQHKFVRAIERIANETKESKNISFKPSEILLNFGKTVSCEFTKAYILDSKTLHAHEEGTVYVHNLDYFNLGSLSSTHLIFNNDLLKNNFANNILKLVLDAKEEVDGEITISKLDYILIPCIIDNYRNILKEKLLKYLNVAGYSNYINEKKVEEIIDHENSLAIDMNIFSSISLNNQSNTIFRLAYTDTIEKSVNLMSESFKELLIGLNNNHKENKKITISLGSNGSFEGMLINKCFLNEISKLERLENITIIFKIKENTDKSLAEMVAGLVLEDKNIAFSFIESSYNKDAKSEVEYFSDGKRIFENHVTEEKSSIGRMIVATTSINMSRLGLKYKNQPINLLFKELDDILELVKTELLMVFETIGDKLKDNYQIIFNNNILDDEKLETGQRIRKVIKNGVLNIGLVGLKECSLNMSKEKDDSKKILVNILEHINNKNKEFIEDNKLSFVVSETSKIRPLKELMILDKAIYGIQKDITDKKYYSRIDSLFDFKENIVDDFKYLGIYQKLLTGGCLIEASISKNTSIKKLLECIKMAYDADIGYIKFRVGKKELK